MTSTTHDATPIYSTLAQDPGFQDLVALFVEEMPDKMSVLEAALERGDLAGLQRAAHQLKGSAGSYGFDELTPLAAAVEFSLTEQESLESVGATLEELLSACRRVDRGTPS